MPTSSYELTSGTCRKLRLSAHTCASCTLKEGTSPEVEGGLLPPRSGSANRLPPTSPRLHGGSDMRRTMSVGDVLPSLRDISRISPNATASGLRSASGGIDAKVSIPSGLQPPNVEAWTCATAACVRFIQLFLESLMMTLYICFRSSDAKASNNGKHAPGRRTERRSSGGACGIRCSGCLDEILLMICSE